MPRAQPKKRAAFVSVSADQESDPKAPVRGSVKASQLRLADFPPEIQQNILEHLSTSTRLKFVKTAPPPNSKKKQTSKAPSRTSQCLAVLLVSKTFVDQRMVVDTMIQNATFVLKRSHFDVIEDFLNERQRHLVQRVKLDWNIEFAQVKGQYVHTTFGEIRHKFPNIKQIDLELDKYDPPILSFDPREPFRGRKFHVYFQSMPPCLGTTLWKTPGAWIKIMNQKQVRGTVEIFRNPLRRTSEEVDFTYRLKESLTITDFANAIIEDKAHWRSHISEFINMRVFDTDCDCYNERPRTADPSTICRLAVFLRNAYRVGVEVTCPVRVELTEYRQNCVIVFKVSII